VCYWKGLICCDDAVDPAAGVVQIIPFDVRDSAVPCSLESMIQEPVARYKRVQTPRYAAY